MSDPMDDPGFEMPWGKHKGKYVHDLEPSYLVWVYFEADKASNGLRRAIRRHMLTLFEGAPVEDLRKTEERANMKISQAAKLAKAESVFRKLAKEYHPDKKDHASTLAFQAITRFAQMMVED